MTCSACGRRFGEAEADRACQGCGAHGGCHLVKCPYCHYEQAAMPKWVARLKDLMTGKKGNFEPLYQDRPVDGDR